MVTHDRTASEFPVLGVFDPARTHRLTGAGRAVLRHRLEGLRLLWGTVLKDVMLLGAALFTTAEFLEAARPPDHSGPPR